MNFMIQQARRGWTAALSALAFAAMVTSAHADPVLLNGNFEQTLTATSSQFGSAFPSQQVTGWATDGYNFVFRSGTADTTGANGQFGNVALWGLGNGSANGLPASSPAGGNFIAMDGDFETTALTQTVTGLTVGQATTVSFYFAGAQQAGFSGASTDQLQVSLGSQTDLTSVLSDPSQGFTGWQLENLTFTPTSTSEILSFLAIGTPSGVPPFSLLDGVTVASASPVPEPASLVMLSTGLIGLGGYMRRRFKKN
jgi:hypothetical protein